MAISITEVDSSTKLRAFIHLPAKIHKGHSNWVPPIYMDEWSYFNREQNQLFAHCDSVLLLAYKNKKLAGRCMGLIHRRYNSDHGENNARFAYLETYDDKEVFDALMAYVENWAKQKGMEKLIGPLAFSDKDPQGFLIEGFDEPVSIATNCSFPYMVDFTGKAGFSKMIDLVVYKIDIPDKLPEIYHKIEERYNRNNGKLTVVSFKKRSHVKPYIRPILGLINKTFIGVYGFTPFSEKEMDEFATRYMYLINPKFVKIVVNENNEVVGTVIGMSDISEGIRKSRGYLFPFGLIHILRAGKKSKQLNLLLGAVDQRYQGRGIDVMMGKQMIESAKEEGKTVIDSHLELENNHAVRAEMERMGGVVYKRYRIFEKKL